MKYFQLIEFQKSAVAKKRGIDNSIPQQYIQNVYNLVNNILDPLKEAWGGDIIVTSGFRCDAVNNAVGGSTTSAHSYALAADLVPSNGKLEEFKQFTMEWLYANNILFDQYINEYQGSSSWVHIGYTNRAGKQRKQWMLYKNKKYTRIDPLTYKRGQNNTNIQNNSNISSNNIEGQISGKLIYNNEEDDIEAIKTNNVFTKSESGQPTIDKETGKYEVNDLYLEEVDEHVGDELEDISEIPLEPNQDIEDFSVRNDCGGSKTNDYGYCS